MGRNNKSIHLLRGIKNNHSSEVLDSGQPFYDKYGRSIYIGDGSTSLNDLVPISGGWDYIDEGEASTAGYYIIPSSKILSKIKTAGFLYCSNKGDIVAIQDLNRDDGTPVKDRWYLIYIRAITTSGENEGAILAIGASVNYIQPSGIFYGTISDRSIKWKRLSGQKYLEYFTQLGDSFNISLNKESNGEKEVIPSSTRDINLGSSNNMWSNLYVQNVGTAVNPVPNAHIDNIYPNLIYPKNNNEINFDLQGAKVENIYFGNRGSTNKIISYRFINGQNSYNGYADIGCNNINSHEIKSDAVRYDGSGNVDNTKCHYFVVPDGKTQRFGTINLPANTKGAISSSGVDCCLWYATVNNESSVAGFLTYNSGSGWYKSAIEAPYFNATSDKRLKENIVPFTSEKSILDLPVYTFNFKSDKNKKKHVGCLAQDLQEICPDLVNEDSQGYLSIEESKITYLLLEEVKDLKKQVEELKGKINELEGK